MERILFIVFTKYNFASSVSNSAAGLPLTSAILTVPSQFVVFNDKNLIENDLYMFMGF